MEGLFDMCFWLIAFLLPLCIVDLLCEHTSAGRRLFDWLACRLGFSDPPEWL